MIHLAQNQGKAIALQAAAAARSEFLVCIDGDALLDRDAAAIWWRRCWPIRTSAR